MLLDMSVKDFMKETASSSPVPGGGSIAALSASSAASLSAMVANLTIGKKGYEDVQEEMMEIAKKAEELKDKLLVDIDRDAESFYKVMKGFKLPKETDLEKADRSKYLQESYKEAAIVPMEIAKSAFEIMALAEKVIVKGNKNAVTDGAVSAMLARTAVLSALLNVKINLGSIKDESFVADLKNQVEELEGKAIIREKEILDLVTFDS